MADMQGSKLPGASPVIARRDVARWLAFALAGLHPGELFGQSIAPRIPGVRQRHAEPVKFLDAATLRRTIRSAPESRPRFTFRMSRGRALSRNLR